MKEYFFAMGSQEFLFKQEPLEEVLRERKNYKIINNQEIDFWVIENPKFLEDKKFAHLKKIFNNRSTAVIVSTNPQFIDWLKLRILYVYVGSIKSDLLPNNL